MIKVLSSNTLARRTGRYRFRTSLRGKLILQVEWSQYESGSYGYSVDRVLIWKDAKLTDIDFTEESDVL
jgi:hypothetical protein